MTGLSLENRRRRSELTGNADGLVVVLSDHLALLVGPGESVLVGNDTVLLLGVEFHRS